MIRCIAAIDEKQGIADDHGIPWQGKIPRDVKYYHEKIKGTPVLMGYGLYKELSHPYPESKNYVASSKDEQLKPGFELVKDAVEFVKNFEGDLWDLGGAMIFAVTLDYVDEIYVTQLQGNFNCTKFFPKFKDQFEKVSETEPTTENGVTYTFQVWKRIKALA